MYAYINAAPQGGGNGKRGKVRFYEGKANGLETVYQEFILIKPKPPGS